MENKIENSRVLVTGGAGFIGSNLIDSLIRQNNEVICLDNFFTGKRENIAHHSKNENFTLIEGDICDLHECNNQVKVHLQKPVFRSYLVLSIVHILLLQVDLYQKIQLYLQRQCFTFLLFQSIA